MLGEFSPITQATDAQQRLPQASTVDMMPAMAAAEKAREKRQNLRKAIFPDGDDEVFAVREARGFARVPRVVPLACRWINTEGGKVNAGPLYQTLWAQDWGEGFIDVQSREDLLYEAGYPAHSQRVERTWNERVKVLDDLGFIRLGKRGQLNPSGYVLLVDPYLALARLHVSSKLTDHVYWSQLQVFCLRWGVKLDEYVSRARAEETQ
jgi:hypothetical protein